MNNKKTPSKQRKQIVDKKIVDALKTVDNPIRNALIVALIWQVILILFAVAIHFIGKRPFVENINISFFIGLAIAAIWTFLKWGLLEGLRLKTKNWSNKRIIKTLDVDEKNIVINLDDYRSLNKQRSWWGVYVMLAINVIGIVSTIPFVI